MLNATSLSKCPPGLQTWTSSARNRALGRAAGTFAITIGRNSYNFSAPDVGLRLYRPEVRGATRRERGTGRVMNNVMTALSGLSPWAIELITRNPDALLRFAEIIDGMNLSPEVIAELAKVRPDEWARMLEALKDNPVFQAAAQQTWERRSFSGDVREREEVESAGRRTIEELGLWGGVIGGVGAAILGASLAILGLLVAVGGFVGAIIAAPTGVGGVIGLFVGAGGLVGAIGGLAMALFGVIAGGGSILGLIAYYMPTHVHAKGIGTAIFGGSGGAAFIDDVSQVKRVKLIRVGHGAVVDSVQFVWELRDGRTDEGKRHGGGGGNQTHFELQDGETLVKITGRSGGFVDQLTFHTSRGRSFGPYGGGGGKDFTLVPEHGDAILGLHGRAGHGLDAIGACSSIYGSAMFGGRGGEPFLDDLSVAVRIKRICVRHGGYIDSIQVAWLDDQDMVYQGRRHGGGGGTEGSIDLAKDETIVRVSGCTGQFVDRLEFTTSKGRVFTFGGGGGSAPFTIDVAQGQRIIGFWGRAGTYLDSIGICLASGGREPVRIGQHVALLSDHRRFLVAEEDLTIRANREEIGAYESFKLVGVGDRRDGDELHYGDAVALLTHHGRHVVAEQDHAVKADRERVGAWETFTLVHPGDSGSTAVVSTGDRVALRSHHGLYLVAEADHSVCADRTAIGAWETWLLAVLR